MDLNKSKEGLAYPVGENLVEKEQPVLWRGRLGKP